MIMSNNEQHARTLPARTALQVQSRHTNTRSLVSGALAASCVRLLLSFALALPTRRRWQRRPQRQARPPPPATAGRTHVAAAHTEPRSRAKSGDHSAAPVSTGILYVLSLEVCAHTSSDMDAWILRAITSYFLPISSREDGRRNGPAHASAAQLVHSGRAHAA